VLQERVCMWELASTPCLPPCAARLMHPSVARSDSACQRGEATCCSDVAVCVRTSGGLKLTCYRLRICQNSIR
jgi:hypothetical protein